MSARPQFLLMNGKYVRYADAAVHPLSTGFKYAAAVFEGLRAYRSSTDDRYYIFRLTEHLRRLRQSCLLAGIPLEVSDDQLRRELLALIRHNDQREDLHIRIQAYIDCDDGNIAASGPVSYAMATMPMAPTSIAGLTVAVSSWSRIADHSTPPRIKSSANYHNSRLALMQARRDGYDEVLLLTGQGHVAEGAGYCVVLVRDGALLTPRTTDGILESITRDSLLHLAALAGLEVVERGIDRSELYLADEIFLCGSAKEVTPVISVDRVPVGAGECGPVTRQLRETYLRRARGTVPDDIGWLTEVLDTYDDGVTTAREAALR